MTAKLIKGTEIRDVILKEIGEEVKKIKEKHGKVPGLGDDSRGAESCIDFVCHRQRSRRQKASGSRKSRTTNRRRFRRQQLLALIDKYNKDDSINGILVQLPLPKHINEKKILNAIDPDKDVDGFHPVNVGRLMIGGSEVKFPPCTPAGIQELIVRSGVETKGAEVVVVGRSNIVGKPIAVIMLQKAQGANATVTVAHTGTKDLAFHCKRADILIVAAGVPGPGQTRVDQARRLCH